MRLLRNLTGLAIGFAAACGGDTTRPPVPVLTTVAVTLTPSSITADGSAVATASGKDQFSAAIALGMVAWTTSDPSVATVSASGAITAVAQGATQVIATIGAVSGTSVLTVIPIPVARITLAPTGIRLAIGATQQLTATLFDSHGNTLVGRTIVWSTSDATKAEVSATGLVTAIANGTVAITAASEGQTASATVNLGPEPVASVTVSPPTDTLVIGATATLTSIAVGQTGTVLTGRIFTWTSSNSAVVSISASGNVATATAVGAGIATITATSENIPGSATITVTLPPPACPREQALRMNVGEVRTLTTDQIASTCLGGDAFSSEYVLVPFNTATVTENVARLQITGTNTAPVLAATVASISKSKLSSRSVAAAMRLPASTPSIVAGEIAFKNHERTELASRLSAIRGRGPVLSRRQLLSVPTAPTIGAVYGLNSDITTTCGVKQIHGARVVGVLAHTIVLVDTLAPVGGYTDAELLAFGTAFDTLGFPLDTLNFGAPSDIDGNGRVAIFFTPGVNVLPAPPGAIVAGTFAVRDLLPTTGAGSCSGSNEGEMFYVPVPDPRFTINTSYGDKGFLSNTVAGVLVHEFQHLINAGRRIYVNNSPVGEDVWLNEGLSHVAEELLYYRMSGNSPRSNITGSLLFSTAAQTAAYKSYMSTGDIEDLWFYMLAPEVNAPNADFDALETRGAAWELLRYAADRKGGTERNTWFALANSLTAGTANFTAVFGGFANIMRDWTIAQFTDDAGLSVAAQYTYPSWSYRSVFAADAIFGVWPLSFSFHPLPSGTPVNLLLIGGGTTYVRFRVNANFVASVTSTSSGSAVPSTVSYVLVRTQ